MINRRMKGFTLIELMIVVVIVAILAAIAIPSYQNQVIKSGRADGKAAIMSAAQFMERCFTENSAYNNAACTVAFPMLSEEGLYSVTLDPGLIPSTTYILTAIPQNAQTRDTECGDLTLNQAGVRGISGTGTVETCW